MNKETTTPMPNMYYVYKTLIDVVRDYIWRY